MDSESFGEKSSIGATEALRSDRSREFENFWRNVPRAGLVPHRRDVKPAHAPSLLRDIVILEAQFGEKPSLRFRLAGSAIQERVQGDITGADYLDLRPSEHRADTIAFARLITDHPCGFWQTLPMHYARGFAQNYEFTAFPLLGDNAPLIIGLMNPLQGLVQSVAIKGKPLLAEASTMLHFIDIGAGKPARPS
jgi:hypothetical protein